MAEQPAPDGEFRRAQLTRLAAQGMTVLTNRDGVLPLARSSRVALVGRHAVSTVGMGGGSAQVNPPYQVSVAQGLTAQLGVGLTVSDGVDVLRRPVPASGGFLVDPRTGGPGVRFTLFGADGEVLEERSSSDATTMVGFDDDFEGTVVSVRLEARITRTGAAVVGPIGVGDWQLSVGPHELSFPLRVSGTSMGEEVLHPPIRTETLDITDGDLFSATVTLLAKGADGAMAGVGRYGLVGTSATPPAADVIAAAVRAAALAEVAVVVVGLTVEQETEAVDKATLALPGEQDALVSAVAAAAPRTVVVVNAATPVLMPWLDQVDAVLWAGLPGQESGHAVAAALLGEIEPAGRLVTSFPAADGASPAWSITPVDGELAYTEGLFIGYRGHDAGLAPEPAFWFGHGLGYGSWEYSSAEPTAGGAAVTVLNSGARPSREVVQLYFRPEESDLPVRLVGWACVTLDPGASARVEVPADARMLRRWDTATSSWAALRPGGEFLFARGLGDPRAAVARRSIG